MPSDASRPQFGGRVGVLFLWTNVVHYWSSVCYLSAVCFWRSSHKQTLHTKDGDEPKKKKKNSSFL